MPSPYQRRTFGADVQIMMEQNKICRYSSSHRLSFSSSINNMFWFNLWCYRVVSFLVLGRLISLEIDHGGLLFHFICIYLIPQVDFMNSLFLLQVRLDFFYQLLPTTRAMIHGKGYVPNSSMICLPIHNHCQEWLS